MFKTLIIALVALVNLGCEIEFRPEANPSLWTASDDAGHFTDDAGREWARGEVTCIVNDNCPPGQQCIDREWCYTPVEGEVMVDGEVSGNEDLDVGSVFPDDEGPLLPDAHDSASEGEGEGEGSPLCELVEICSDDLDNDCDGSADEGCECNNTSIRACGLNVGECRPGLQSCEEDGSWGSCEGARGPTPELCNGLDDDCDGLEDDGLDVGAVCSNGVGACARNGLVRCKEDGSGTECDALIGAPHPELCNGLDDDCDGLEDDGLGESSCGIGACVNTAPNCVNGAPPGCVPLPPHPELCNGLDDDCDGEVDEGNPGSGGNCDTGEPGVCALGMRNCERGVLVCTPLVSPSDEACDQLDNDCDGEVDEGVAPRGYSCIPPTGPDGFLMGTSIDDPERDDDEVLPHLVIITRPFLIRQTEVTQRAWTNIMGDNPAAFRNCGDNCPVETIDWFQAINYANALSRSQGLEECYIVDGGQVTWPRGLDCAGYRLPTEAEWEYAARAGEDGPTYGPLDDIAWCAANSGGSTHPVCEKERNAWGLCDVIGDVWEYVWDIYGPFGPDDQTDPIGPDGGPQRTVRGGYWDNLPNYCRLAGRLGSTPSSAGAGIGFRVVRSIN